MCTLSSCPYCGREAHEADSFPWFPVYTCVETECRTKYCADDGPLCPECSSSRREEYDQVHPWAFR